MNKQPAMTQPITEPCSNLHATPQPTTASVAEASINQRNPARLRAKPYSSLCLSTIFAVAFPRIWYRTCRSASEMMASSSCGFVATVAGISSPVSFLMPSYHCCFCCVEWAVSDTRIHRRVGNPPRFFQNASPNLLPAALARCAKATTNALPAPPATRSFFTQPSSGSRNDIAKTIIGKTTMNAGKNRALRSYESATFRNCKTDGIPGVPGSDYLKTLSFGQNLSPRRPSMARNGLSEAAEAGITLLTLGRVFQTLFSDAVS